MSLKKHVYALAALLSVAVAPPLFAGGPFGLFDHLDGACDSGCGSSCDASSCDGFDSCDSIGSQCDSYVSLFGGLNVMDNILGDPRPTPPVIVDGTFNDGLAVGIARGRQLGTDFRGELELSYRTNTGEEWDVNGTPGTWSGRADALSGMANLYYDLSDFQIGEITPYAGAGLGLSLIDGRFQTNGGASIKLNDESFTYQLIAGGSKRLNDCVSGFAEYRYVVFDSVDMSNVTGATPVDLNGRDLDMHTIFFGLRFAR